MKRVIVDYKKLTSEVLNLLKQKFPDGYGDKDIIVFDDHNNQTIEAIEIKTESIIYLVKVSSRLHYTMTNFDTDNIMELNQSGHIIMDQIETPQKGELRL